MYLLQCCQRHFRRKKKKKSVWETNTSINVSLCTNATISLSISRFIQRGCNDGGVSSCVWDSRRGIKHNGKRGTTEKYEMWGCVVKAPSAWLTYIGSLPLTSYWGSSLTNTGLRARTHSHTHSLSITQDALFIDASRSLSFSLFSAPPFLSSLTSVCVWHVCLKLCCNVLCNQRTYQTPSVTGIHMGQLNYTCSAHPLKTIKRWQKWVKAQAGHRKWKWTNFKNSTQHWCWPGSVAVGVGSEHQVPGPGPDCHCPPLESHAWWLSCSPQGRSWQSWPLRERWPGGKSQPPQL